MQNGLRRIKKRQGKSLLLFWNYFCIFVDINRLRYEKLFTQGMGEEETLKGEYDGAGTPYVVC